MNSNQKFYNLFVSKKSKIFSEIKLTLLLFCCYYIITRYYNIHMISINDLLECRNAKDELTYDDLNTLIKVEIKNIFKKSDCQNYENFFEIFKDGINFLGAKLSKKILLSNIEDSIQALGIMIFGFYLCKQKIKVNDNIDFYMRKTLINFKEILNNYYGCNKLPIIINWLNNNWYK